MFCLYFFSSFNTIWYFLFVCFIVFMFTLFRNSLESRIHKQKPFSTKLSVARRIIYSDEMDIRRFVRINWINRCEKNIMDI